MSWFSHKKEGKRDFGDLPALPEPMTNINFNIPKRSDFLENPIFPDNDEYTQSLPPLPETKPRQELPMPSMPKIPSIPKTKSFTGNSENPEPIFIRLDNFQATLRAFTEIKSRINEIEHLLTRTKELKEKEQKELEEWERELQGLKARMDSIDKTLFNKLE